MPCYDYKCKSCNRVHELHNIALECRNESQVCPDCLSETCDRVFCAAPRFIIAETNDPISAKPDSYWANAELNAKRRKKKEAEAKKEKEFYGGN